MEVPHSGGGVCRPQPVPFQNALFPGLFSQAVDAFEAQSTQHPGDLLQGLPAFGIGPVLVDGGHPGKDKIRRDYVILFSDKKCLLFIGKAPLKAQKTSLADADAL